MTKKARTAVQNRFMKNKAKIVAATSAFGMGLDKHNVRVIVHYDYPLCFESFVQEVGRAGRDNLPAYSYVISDFTSVTISLAFTLKANLLRFLMGHLTHFVDKFLFHTR